MKCLKCNQDIPDGSKFCCHCGEKQSNCCKKCGFYLPIEARFCPSCGTAITPTNIISGHDYVDLGLSVKWATCNVGASSPSDYGNYYAWGETSPKSSYTERSSKFYRKKYEDIGRNSNTDAACANWGGSWRLPTRAEFEELLNENNCTWTWTTQEGHNGYKVTSKKNGNSIFLPAAGYRRESSSNNVGSYGRYWSSTPYERDTDYAYFLDFDDVGPGIDFGNRSRGFSVRPVSE